MRPRSHSTQQPRRRASTRRPSPYRRFGLIAAIASLALVGMMVTLLNVHWYIAWIVGWSVVTLLFYGWDKGQSRQQGQRIPEFVLHGLALVGGFPGGWLGRALFRHKTQHVSFLLVLVVSTLLHIGLVWWLWQ
ncbi:MAG: DUF1294 domain-containing protein [Chloroflexota bacterium]